LIFVDLASVVDFRVLGSRELEEAIIGVLVTVINGLDDELEELVALHNFAAEHARDELQESVIVATSRQNQRQVWYLYSLLELRLQNLFFR